MSTTMSVNDNTLAFEVEPAVSVSASGSGGVKHLLQPPSAEKQKQALLQAAPEDFQAHDDDDDDAVPPASQRGATTMKHESTQNPPTSNSTSLATSQQHFSLKRSQTMARVRRTEKKPQATTFVSQVAPSTADVRAIDKIPINKTESEERSVFESQPSPPRADATARDSVSPFKSLPRFGSLAKMSMTDDGNNLMLGCETGRSTFESKPAQSKCDVKYSDKLSPLWKADAEARTVFISEGNRSAADVRSADPLPLLASVRASETSLVVYESQAAESRADASSSRVQSKSGGDAQNRQQKSVYESQGSASTAHARASDKTVPTATSKTVFESEASVANVDARALDKSSPLEINKEQKSLFEKKPAASTAHFRSSDQLTPYLSAESAGSLELTSKQPVKLYYSSTPKASSSFARAGPPITARKQNEEEIDKLKSRGLVARMAMAISQSKSLESVIDRRDDGFGEHAFVSRPRPSVAAARAAEPALDRVSSSEVKSTFESKPRPASQATVRWNDPVPQRKDASKVVYESVAKRVVVDASAFVNPDEDCTSDGDTSACSQKVSPRA